MKTNAGPSVHPVAQKNGVRPTWKDVDGRIHRASEDALAKISAALAPLGETDSADHPGFTRLETADKTLALYVPHVAVLKRSLEKELARLEIDIPFESKRESVFLHWSLLAEWGDMRSGITGSADLTETKLRIHLPETTHIGYYKLVVGLTSDKDPKTVKLKSEFPVIIAPDKCFMPATFNNGARFWGPVVNLTGFTSKRNWGTGDFTDLKAIVAFCAAQGAGVVGVSPLHGQDPTGSNLFTRRLPSDRSFLNIIYIDVEATDDFHESEDTRRMVQSPEFQERIETLRSAEVADLKQIFAEKLHVLDRLYQQFRSRHLSKQTPRAQAFRAFQHERGKPLRYFATHQALAEKLAKDGNHYESWRAWPDKYRDPESEAVKEFAASNNERIEFFEYLQWQAEIQLETVGHACMNSRLPVGILTEVSPLVSPHGAEGWQNQKCLAETLFLTEPPRPYLPDGLVTASPPFRMEEMRRAGYRPLAEMLQFNMRYAGAIKLANAYHWLAPLVSVDPDNISSAAQLELPVEEILSVIALESHRTSTMVVLDAELLLELDARSASGSQIQLLLEKWNIIARHDLLSTAPNEVSSLMKPETTEKRLLELAPADLSPLAAFWHGTDITVRAETLPVDEKDKRNQLIDRRVSHRVEVLRLLDEKNLLPEGVTTDPSSVPVLTPHMVSALVALMAKSTASLVLFRLEDLGTLDRPLIVLEDPSYPQWKVKTNPSFEEMIEAETTQLVIDQLQTERGCFFDLVDVSYNQEDLANKQVTIPLATYRLQLHKDFKFVDAHKLVTYLDKLGISHYYLSPISQSRPGSMHGYDVISHSTLNPELGTLEDLEELSADLRKRDMGIIMDLVPNHMGIGKHNPWWMDVLEHGPASEYGEYFDIDWSPVKDELVGKVLLPILGEPYGKILTNGELKIKFDKSTGKFKIHYYENEFPVNPSSYALIMGLRLHVLNDRLGNTNMDVMRYLSIVDALSSLPDGMNLSQEDKSRRLREMKVSIDRLAELCGQNEHIHEFIQQNLKEFDCTEDDRASCRRLHELLEQQSYRLAFWRVAAHEINYRRFFDINELAGVRVEDPRAFTDMHALVFKLIKDGIVQGLRIDHPDGLYDPAGYFMKLQEEALSRLNPDSENFLPGQKRFQRQEEYPIYLLGEKILAPFERMEDDWVIHGTTGYDFMTAANGVLIDEKNARIFSDFYAMVSNETDSYRELAYRCKHLIMQTSLASELNMLAHHLSQIAESNWMYRDFTLNSLRHALSEVVAFFPVYRTYVKEGTVSNVARDYVVRAVRLAKRNNRTVHPGIFDFIHHVLTLRLADEMDGYPAQEEFQQNVLNFAMKFQQFTGPVMAKSLEDTLFYKYNRFVGLNEVGGEPNHFGLSIADFHSHNEARQKTYPYSMLATSTHDTKRSEDVRARLSVLSEIPDNWQERVLRWMDYNSGRYTYNLDKRIPSNNDEYLLYQTLVGTYPLTVEKPEDLADFAQRIEGYMLKAAREAKDHTSWINQDANYEDGMKSFINALLKPSNAEGGSDPFFIDFLEFHQHVSRMGLIKSLSQTLFKLTCPGVPDFYQGNELFDFSLVDPDNRRPVDFDERDRLLTNLLPFVKPDTNKSQDEFKALLKDMLKNYKDGRLKLFVTAAILQQRKLNPRLFTAGKYIPVGVSGEGSDHFIAYLREYQGKSLLVVAPVLVSKLISPDQRALYSGPEDTSLWQSTKLNLPREFQRRTYTDIFTGQTMEFGERRARITQILERFPVALLTAK